MIKDEITEAEVLEAQGGKAVQLRLPVLGEVVLEYRRLRLTLRKTGNDGIMGVPEQASEGGGNTPSTTAQ